MADCSGNGGHDHHIKLLLIGDSGVGKSSLVSRFTRGKFRPDQKPTATIYGVERHVYVDGKVIKVLILDIAGTGSHNINFSDNNFTEIAQLVNGALVVYDVTSLSTFENAKSWCRELHFPSEKFEVMLVGNKSDLTNDSFSTLTEAGKTFAEREQLGFTITSALDNINVEKSFVQVVTRIFNKLFKNDTIDAVHAHAFPAISSQARMSRYSGKNEPAHYMLKVESFSLLSEARSNKFESAVFEACGYKWRLELYPNGNDEENAGNHISMYVAICDAESLPKGWEVWVDCKFCLYDHLHHDYVTFQDVDGKRTKFHEKKMKWGFSKLISLASFTDAGNGFLCDDSCVFGVEVFVVSKYAANDHCLTLIKPAGVINTYTWTIENFSAVTDDVLYSDDFKIGKVKWRLSMYPKGYGEETDTNLSIFLQVHDFVMLPAEWRVYAEYKIRVKNRGSHADKEIEDEAWFCKSAPSWGYPSFMLLSEVGDPEKGFLLHDVFVVQAEISVVGMVKNFN